MVPESFEHAGRAVPAWVGDPAGEYTAARRAAVWLPLPWRTVVAVRGRDAAPFLHGMLTQQVAGLSPGDVRRACQVDRRGRLVAEMWVRRVVDGVELDIQVDRVDAVLDILDRHRIAEDVDWDRAIARPVVLLAGPEATRIARAVDLPGWPVRETGRADLRYCPPDPEAFGNLLTAAGASRIGGRTLDRLRIEAGIPWFGREMGPDSLPLEVGLDDAVALDKGCYLGQEAIARIHYQGRLRAGLAGIRFPSEPALPGAPIIWQEEEIGTLRSVAPPPKKDEGQAIGLALLRRDCIEEGWIVRVGSREGRIESLPFREGRDV